MQDKTHIDRYKKHGAKQLYSNKKTQKLSLLFKALLICSLTIANISAISALPSGFSFVKAAEPPTTPAPATAPAATQETKPPSTESFSVGKYLKEKDQGQAYLKSDNPVASFIVQIINFLVLTIGSFSFLAVIFGGITLLTSHGNETQVTKGKEILKYAITGLVVTLSAYFITAFVQSLFYELPG